MERAAARQRHYAKALLALAGAALACLYLWFAALQLRRPFATPHLAPFAKVLRPHAVAAADGLGAATAALATLAALSFPGHQRHGSWRTLLALAALLAALLAAFWSIAAWRVVHASPSAPLWRVSWLPVTPPAFVLLIAAAVSVMRGTEAGVDSLRRARYAYKRA